jgi:hypothetical protein
LKLIAKKSLRYAGRSLVAGDDFEASAKYARLLKAIGKAGDAPPVEPAPEAPAEPKPRKGYKRRDMTAED